MTQHSEAVSSRPHHAGLFGAFVADRHGTLVTIGCIKCMRCSLKNVGFYHQVLQPCLSLCDAATTHVLYAVAPLLTCQNTGDIWMMRWQRHRCLRSTVTWQSGFSVVIVMRWCLTVWVVSVFVVSSHQWFWSAVSGNINVSALISVSYCVAFCCRQQLTGPPD